jgi:hypothetical protein
MTKSCSTDTIDITQRMPIEKLSPLPPTMFDILLFEPVGAQETEKLRDMYSTLEKDNMVSIVFVLLIY